MNRIYEALKHVVALAPASVSASTETATAFVDAGGAREVEFLVSTAALGNGKKLKVGVYTSDAAEGTGAVLAAEAEFTAGDETSGLAVISYSVTALGGRYVGVKFQHDAASAVVCGVTASLLGQEMPAENAWTLTA